MQVSSYGFTHGKLRKTVDTSVPFRFSGLDSNCQLDLVRARDGSGSAGGKGGPVRVALQLPSGRFVVRHCAVVACERGGAAGLTKVVLAWSGHLHIQNHTLGDCRGCCECRAYGLGTAASSKYSVCVCVPCTVCADCC